MRMLFVFTLFFSTYSFPVLAEMVADSCECPKLECDPCQDQKGVTFYTEKCGGGDRMRSCARPTCKSKDPAPVNCAVAKKDVAPEAKQAERSVANIEATVDEKTKVVGTLAVVKGSVTIKDPSGKIVQLKEGAMVHEKDMIETSGSGQTQIKFNDGNIVHVREDSQVRIDTYDVEDRADKKAVFDLLKGKIRNQVMKKYDGKQSKYEIRTKAAVAGVRGTDFIVTWMDGEKDVTRIDTFNGEVKLKGRAEGANEEATIKQNQSISYVVDGPSEALADEEIKEFTEKGHFTELAELSEMEVAKLDIATRVGGEVGAARAIASKPEAQGICNSPKAPFNSCLWKCANNPKGSKTCRTDLPQVTCVRARCNANGDWAEETRLPASFHGMCPPSEFTVAPCDY